MNSDKRLNNIFWYFYCAFITFWIIFAVLTCTMYYATAEIRKGSNADYKHLFIGSKPLQKIYKGSKLIWESQNPPVITTFSVSPSTIDLDTRATGTITFTLAVTGRAGENTYAQIVRLPSGANIGVTHVAANGASISTTLPNITQPQSTTTYRLFARNDEGASHKDTTVTVTKNPTLANCRRTGFNNQGFLYSFGFTLTGLPRPVVTYRFSGGQQGTVNVRHYSQGSNPYTWTIDGWRVTMPSAANQSLTLTATNGSGTTTCSIGNINE